MKWSLLLLAASSLLASGKKTVTLDDVGKPAKAHEVAPVWSPDGKRFAYIEDEKLWLYDIPARSKRELTAMSRLGDAATKPPETEIFDWSNRRVAEQPVQWFENGDQLLIQAEGDLFLVRLDASDAGKARFDQLTATSAYEYDPKLSPDNRYVSFRRIHDLYVLEIATKKVTRLTHDGSATLLNAELDWVYPEELEIGTAHWWSPDSRHLAYLQLDIHNEPIFPQVSLTKTRAVEEPERFPQPGDPNADARLGVVSIGGGETKWMDLGETRGFLIARVAWLPDSKSVAAMRLNRIQNQLDLMKADVEDGSAEVLIHESDPYWINVEGAPVFLKNRKEFLWESERDGFRHLYLYDDDGKLKHEITKGEWAVEAVKRVDETDQQIYYVSEEDSPLERQLYRVDFSGKHKTRLTEGQGVHGVSLSPSSDYFFDSFSSLATPPSQTLRDGDGKEVMVWMAKDSSLQETYDLSVPEIVEVRAPDGAQLYGRLTKPPGFDPTKKYPVIDEVYGGPHVQVILNQWTGVGLSQVLAARGYVIWELDNRGSYGRGHKWESVIFRNLGRHELEDQKTGVEYLKKLNFVDGSRIGMMGWSYGGYMTLYSLCNAPGLFRAGLAGAPVTDWRNYDSIYTERYMGLPSENKDGYDHSAPVSRAAGLASRLLIVHNIEDDNVHFQNSLQMADALEKANKQFRMVVYTQKSHGVGGSARSHLYETMVTFFEENLK